jgi:hypothetical protein
MLTTTIEKPTGIGYRLRVFILAQFQPEIIKRIQFNFIRYCANFGKRDVTLAQ